jgi:hypothetical protein
MFDSIEITREEVEIVDRVAGKFIRRMYWSRLWEFADVRQELVCFWIETRQKGWIRPEHDWQSAMGRCLNLRLKDILKRAYTQKRNGGSKPVSLEQLMEEGQDFPETNFRNLLPDFLSTLPRQDREICKCLAEGKSKTETSRILKRGRPFIDERLQHCRHLAEDYLRI